MTDRIETAFMMDLVGDPKTVERQIMGRAIHAAILCPQINGSEEWAVSVVPIGKVIGFTGSDGTSITRITIDLLHGEVDKV